MPDSASLASVISALLDTAATTGVQKTILELYSVVSDCDDEEGAMRKINREVRKRLFFLLTPRRGFSLSASATKACLSMISSCCNYIASAPNHVALELGPKILVHLLRTWAFSADALLESLIHPGQDIKLECGSENTEEFESLLDQQVAMMDICTLACRLFSICAENNPKFGLIMRLEEGVEVLCGTLSAALFLSRTMYSTPDFSGDSSHPARVLTHLKDFLQASTSLLVRICKDSAGNVPIAVKFNIPASLLSSLIALQKLQERAIVIPANNQLPTTTLTCITNDNGERRTDQSFLKCLRDFSSSLLVPLLSLFSCLIQSGMESCEGGSLLTLFEKAQSMLCQKATLYTHSTNATTDESLQGLDTDSAVTSPVSNPYSSLISLLRSFKDNLNPRIVISCLSVLLAIADSNASPLPPLADTVENETGSNPTSTGFSQILNQLQLPRTPAIILCESGAYQLALDCILANPNSFELVKVASSLLDRLSSAIQTAFSSLIEDHQHLFATSKPRSSMNKIQVLKTVASMQNLSINATSVATVQQNEVRIASPRRLKNGSDNKEDGPLCERLTSSSRPRQIHSISIVQIPITPSPNFLGHHPLTYIPLGNRMCRDGVPKSVAGHLILATSTIPYTVRIKAVDRSMVYKKMEEKPSADTPQAPSTPFSSQSGYRTPQPISPTPFPVRDSSIPQVESMPPQLTFGPPPATLSLWPIPRAYDAYMPGSSLRPPPPRPQCDTPSDSRFTVTLTRPATAVASIAASDSQDPTRKESFRTSPFRTNAGVLSQSAGLSQVNTVTQPIQSQITVVSAESDLTKALGAGTDEKPSRLARTLSSTRPSRSLTTESVTLNPVLGNEDAVWALEPITLPVWAATYLPRTGYYPTRHCASSLQYPHKSLSDVVYPGQVEALYKPEPSNVGCVKQPVGKSVGISISSLDCEGKSSFVQRINNIPTVSRAIRDQEMTSDISSQSITGLPLDISSTATSGTSKSDIPTPLITSGTATTKGNLHKLPAEAKTASSRNNVSGEAITPVLSILPPSQRFPVVLRAELRNEPSDSAFDGLSGSATVGIGPVSRLVRKSLHPKGLQVRQAVLEVKEDPNAGIPNQPMTRQERIRQRTLLIHSQKNSAKSNIPELSKSMTSICLKNTSLSTPTTSTQCNSSLVADVALPKSSSELNVVNAQNTPKATLSQRREPGKNVLQINAPTEPISPTSLKIRSLPASRTMTAEPEASLLRERLDDNSELMRTITAASPKDTSPSINDNSIGDIESSIRGTDAATSWSLLSQWLKMPHYFPELQLSAAYLPELAPYRAEAIEWIKSKFQATNAEVVVQRQKNNSAATTPSGNNSEDNRPPQNEPFLESTDSHNSAEEYKNLLSMVTKALPTIGHEAESYLTRFLSSSNLDDHVPYPGIPNIPIQPLLNDHPSRKSIDSTVAEFLARILMESIFLDPSSPLYFNASWVFRRHIPATTFSPIPDLIPPDSHRFLESNQNTQESLECFREQFEKHMETVKLVVNRPDTADPSKCIVSSPKSRPMSPHFLRTPSREAITSNNAVYGPVNPNSRMCELVLSEGKIALSRVNVTNTGILTPRPFAVLTKDIPSAADALPPRGLVLKATIETSTETTVSTQLDAPGNCSIVHPVSHILHEGVKELSAEPALDPEGAKTDCQKLTEIRNGNEMRALPDALEKLHVPPNPLHQGYIVSETIPGGPVSTLLTELPEPLLHITSKDESIISTTLLLQQACRVGLSLGLLTLPKEIRTVEELVPSMIPDQNKSPTRSNVSQTVNPDTSVNLSCEHLIRSLAPIRQLVYYRHTEAGNASRNSSTDGADRTTPMTTDLPILDLDDSLALPVRNLLVKPYTWEDNVPMTSPLIEALQPMSPNRSKEQYEEYSLRARYVDPKIPIAYSVDWRANKEQETDSLDASQQNVVNMRRPGAFVLTLPTMAQALDAADIPTLQETDLSVLSQRALSSNEAGEGTEGARGAVHQYYNKGTKAKKKGSGKKTNEDGKKKSGEAMVIIFGNSKDDDSDGVMASDSDDEPNANESDPEDVDGEGSLDAAAQFAVAADQPSDTHPSNPDNSVSGSNDTNLTNAPYNITHASNVSTMHQFLAPTLAVFGADPPSPTSPVSQTHQGAYLDNNISCEVTESVPPVHTPRRKRKHELSLNESVRAWSPTMWAIYMRALLLHSYNVDKLRTTRKVSPLDTFAHSVSLIDNKSSSPGTQQTPFPPRFAGSMLNGPELRRLLEDVAFETMSLRKYVLNGADAFATLSAILTRLGNLHKLPLPRQPTFDMETPPLEFESRFESGNLCSSTRVGLYSYELALDPDINTPGHIQWYYFRIRGFVASREAWVRNLHALGRFPDTFYECKESCVIKPEALQHLTGPEYTLSIKNLVKPGSAYSLGMRPLVYYKYPILQTMNTNSDKTYESSFSHTAVLLPEEDTFLGKPISRMSNNVGGTDLADHVTPNNNNATVLGHRNNSATYEKAPREFSIQPGNVSLSVDNASNAGEHLYQSDKVLHNLLVEEVTSAQATPLQSPNLYAHSPFQLSVSDSNNQMYMSPGEQSLANTSGAANLPLLPFMGTFSNRASPVRYPPSFEKQLNNLEGTESNASEPPQTWKFIPPSASALAAVNPVVPGPGWRRSAVNVVYHKNNYPQTNVIVKNKPIVDTECVDFTSGNIYSVRGAKSSTNGTGTRNIRGAKTAALKRGIGTNNDNPDSSSVAQISLMDGKKKKFTESWKFSVPYGVDEVFFAYCYPYTYSDLRSDILRWKGRAHRVRANLDYQEKANSCQPVNDKAPAPVPIMEEWNVHLERTPKELLQEESLFNANIHEKITNCHIPMPFGFIPKQKSLSDKLTHLSRISKDASANVAEQEEPCVQDAKDFRLPSPLGTYSFAGKILHTTNLCYTLAGNPVPLLTMTDFSSPPSTLALRPYIFLSARVHPSETNASWMIRGVLDVLTSSSPLAQELLKRVIFKIVPMLNPDGVIVGHTRTNLSGNDLNRMWSNPSHTLSPTVYALKQLMMQVQLRAAASARITARRMAEEAAFGSITDPETKLFAAEPLLSQPSKPIDQANSTTTSLLSNHSLSDSYHRGTIDQLEPSIQTPHVGISNNNRDITGSQIPSAALQSPEERRILQDWPSLPPVSQPILLYCDFHGHSRRRNTFTFGCPDIDFDEKDAESFLVVGEKKKNGTPSQTTPLPDSTGLARSSSSSSLSSIGGTSVHSPSTSNATSSLKGNIPSYSAPRMFPKLLASRIDTFSRHCSSHRVPTNIKPSRIKQTKADCARVAMWRDAHISHSFTIEAGFGGPSSGISRSGSHYSSTALEEIGYAFCLALLDLLDGPTGKRTLEASKFL